MSSAHVNKARRRYHYYVSQALLQERTDSGKLPAGAMISKSWVTIGHGRAISPGSPKRHAQ
jgi:hypothetical protein